MPVGAGVRRCNAIATESFRTSAKVPPKSSIVLFTASARQSNPGSFKPIARELHLNTVSLAGEQTVPAPASPWAHWRVALTYRWRHGRWPSLGKPVRFTEWVQWRKLHDRRADLAALTDKAHAKTIAEARLSADYAIPVLWLGQHLPEVAPWAMPFVVKANHGCKQYVIVRTAADYAAARKVSPRWLREAYGTWLDEWHYGAARRLILVEPYIGGAQLPLDYKVYVFGGRAEIVQVHTGRAGKHRWTQYDRNWQPLSEQQRSEQSADRAAPSRLADLLAAAEAMARGWDFIRVDFYCEGDRVLFGEYCLFPGSGLDPFRPDSLDLMLGLRWTDAL